MFVCVIVLKLTVYVIKSAANHSIAIYLVNACADQKRKGIQTQANAQARD